MKTNLFLKCKYIILFVVITFHLSAQDRIITGIVKDALTKEPLIFCNVVLLKPAIGTFTDMKGKFKFTIPISEETLQLVVSYVGYKNDTIKMNPSMFFYDKVCVANLHH